MPGEVPKGWRATSYAEIAVINDQSLSGNTNPEYMIRYFDIASVPAPGVLGAPTELAFADAPSRARRIVRRGDTLVSCVRPYLRSFAYMNENLLNAVASTGFAVLTPHDGVDSTFLYQTVWRDEFLAFLTERMTGSNYPAVNASDVAAAPVLLPPLPEQKKIAAILSSVDEAIQATQAVIDQTRRVKEGLLQDLLTRGLPGRHTRFKQTEIGEIPESWEVRTVGDVCTVLRGASPRPKADPRFYGGPVGRLMVEDVSRDGKYVTPMVDSLTVEGARKSRPMAAGSLVMVCSGVVGVPAILAVDCCIHDGFLGFTDIAAACDREFLYYVFYRLKQQLDASATHGGIFTNLTTSILRDFLIPLPALGEQREIVGALADVDATFAIESSTLAKFQRVKSGLLQDLLTGKVRVTP